jgi:hypothetical protein
LFAVVRVRRARCTQHPAQVEKKSAEEREKLTAALAAAEAASSAAASAAAEAQVKVDTLQAQLKARGGDAAAAQQRLDEAVQQQGAAGEQLKVRGVCVCVCACV